MPKVTLEFFLPEEKDDFELAHKGAQFSVVIDDLDTFLRNKIKYGGLSEDHETIYQEIRNKLWELRNE